MPAVILTPNEKEFYRRECVLSESQAADAWKKKYGNKLETYDALYKHIPGMQRCIAGIDTQEGLRCVESGGLKAAPRPRSVTVTEMSAKSFLNRPKTAKQTVGYGGLGVHSDYIVPPRAANTIYERDYCVTLDEFKPQIRGINMTKTSIDGPWRRPGDGTMAVIPTKWQFPPGTKQPEGLLVRSELRQLRLAKEEAKQKANESHKKLNTQNEIQSLHRINPLKLQTCTDKVTMPDVKQSSKSPEQRVFVRPPRPAQSRSWGPADNTAPKGWYKTDVGPAKIVVLPGRQSVLNTPQTRLNVLKRRMSLVNLS